MMPSKKKGRLTVYTAGTLLLGGNILLGAGNLISNGGFEEGAVSHGNESILPGWNTRGVHEVIKYHSIDEGVFHTGKRSAKISIGDPGKNGYFTPWPKITVKPGAFYRLCFWVRMAGVKGGAGVSVYSLDGDLKTTGLEKSISIPPETEWRNYSLDCRIPSEPAKSYVTFQLGLNGVGTAWYDDVSFEEITDGSKVLVDFYPSSAAEEKALYPIVGEPAHLMFYIFTDEKYDRIKLQITAPEALPLAQAGPTIEDKNNSGMKKIGEEKGRVSYEAPVAPQIVRPMKAASGKLGSACEVLIFKAKENLKKDFLTWVLTGNDEPLAKGVFSIEPLPEMEKSPLPKNFEIYSWYQHHLFPSLEPWLFKDMVQLQDKVGIKGGQFPGLDTGKVCFLKSKGWKIIGTFFNALPDKCLTKAVKGDGLEKLFTAVVGRRDYLDWVFWNYETSPYFKHFCPECQKAFSKFTGLSLNEGKTFDDIITLHPKEFIKFRNVQHQEIVRRFGEAMRRLNIKSGIDSYSIQVNLDDEERNERQLRYGDPRLWTPFVDAYVTEPYVPPSVFWEIVKINKNNLQNANLPVFMDVCPSERHNFSEFSYSLITPELLRLAVLETAALGIPKMILFDGALTLDGRQLVGLRRACSEISVLEEFFRDGGVADGITQFDILPPYFIKHRGVQLGERFLASFFNCHPYRKYQACFQLFVPTPGLYVLSDPTRKTTYTKKNGESIWRKEELRDLSFDINPTDAKFVVVEPATGIYNMLRKETLSGIEMDDSRKDKPDSPGILPKAEGWDCHRDGENNILIENEVYKTAISQHNGAALTRWKIKKNDRELIHFDPNQPGSGFFRDMFWHPERAQWDICADSRANFKSHTQGNMAKAMNSYNAHWLSGRYCWSSTL